MHADMCNRKTQDVTFACISLLPFCHPFYLSIYLPICLPVRLFICLAVHPFLFGLLSISIWTFESRNFLVSFGGIGL
jgi:hypothetical protein